ncbi:PSD1 and planctomycete cytochrome C domain-containing protein [Bremerella sp. JC770]|uniref:PSD1 and planctomycete cytochrome C domain-containing protein n=1 Tax=Bremerella sp. JC770 TaxID=3232137 RepID=UPI00345750F5
MRILALPLPLFVVFLITAQASAETKFSPEHIEFFEKSVRPVLMKRCVECHGPEKQESGLRMDARSAILAGGDSGAAVVIGKPDESELIQAIRYESYEMPPSGQMPAEEIAAIEKWVSLGMPWPEEAEPLLPATFDERLVDDKQHHWAYQPIQNPAAPKVEGDWAANDIDRFVHHRLSEKGIAPSEKANRRTLIRRATFDLTGLPPTAEEVAAFENDQDPNAFEKVIDRLLASDQYGVKWGRIWLDVARYSDTRGYLNDGQDRRFPYAHAYRDYVIDSFNRDTPYDEFLKEQIAADYFAEEGDRRLAGLGLIRIGRQFLKRQDTIDDRIDVVTRGVLGLTVSCARCHDHKYDAINMADYYGLYGVFDQLEETTPLVGPIDADPNYPQFKKKLDELQGELDQHIANVNRTIQVEASTHFFDFIVRAVSKKQDVEIATFEQNELDRKNVRPHLVSKWKLFADREWKPDHPVWGPLFRARELGDEPYTAQAEALLAEWTGEQSTLNPAVRSALVAAQPKSLPELVDTYDELLKPIGQAYRDDGFNRDAFRKFEGDQLEIAKSLLGRNSPVVLNDNDVRRANFTSDRNHQKKLEGKIRGHEIDSAGSPPRAMAVVDRDKIHDPQIFLRGDPGRRGDRVSRQFLRVLDDESEVAYTNGSGRLELAEDIVADDNPLTSRVMVNRVWMGHFDQPLVLTPGDFGVRSDPPALPQLLDHLATYLRTNDWSLKKLHKYIMLSSTYQQSSEDRADVREKDPENRLFWRMNRRRLSFEEMRDGMLKVSGELDASLGGRAVEILKDPNPPRRTVYGFVDRQDLPNLYRAFDYPSPDAMSPERSKTSVPQQALYLLNSSFVQRLAQQVNQKWKEDPTLSDPQRLERLFQAVLQRSPTEQESEMFLKYVESSTDEEKWSKWDSVAQVVMVSNDFMFVD